MTAALAASSVDATRSIVACEAATDALNDAVANSPSPFLDSLQIGVASLDGNGGVSVASYSGPQVYTENCTTLGGTYSVQATLQTSTAVCNAMTKAFENAQGSLVQRLIEALILGGAAGVDARGENSAAVRLYASETSLNPLVQTFGFTFYNADSYVHFSPDWKTDVHYSLNKYMTNAAFPDDRDFVPLTSSLKKKLVPALAKLGYNNGIGDLEHQLGAFLTVNAPLFPDIHSDKLANEEMVYGPLISSLDESIKRGEWIGA